MNEGVALSGVSVPAAFASKRAVSNITTSTFTVQPVGGFAGIGYVDLSVTSSNGEVRTERAFLTAS